MPGCSLLEASQHVRKAWGTRGKGKSWRCPVQGQASLQPRKINSIPISPEQALKDFSKANTWPLADNSHGPNWQLLIVPLRAFWTGGFHAHSPVGSGLGLQSGKQRRFGDFRLFYNATCWLAGDSSQCIKSPFTQPCFKLRRYLY